MEEWPGIAVPHHLQEAGADLSKAHKPELFLYFGSGARRGPVARSLQARVRC